MTQTTTTPKKKSAAAIQRLFDKANKAVAKAQGKTVASRKATILTDMQQGRLERLKYFKDLMSSFIDLATLDLGDLELMTESQAHTLMTQFLAQRDIGEFMDVCRDRIKEVVFDHLNAEFALAGEEDPSSVNGSIEVPSLGKRFAREGAGYNDPSVNEVLLAEVLGDKIDEVYIEEVIPEQRVRKLSLDKLMDLIDQDPKVMEKVREALIPGTPKTARLVVRDL